VKFIRWLQRLTLRGGSFNPFRKSLLFFNWSFIEGRIVMQILLTGASSLSGYWFATKLHSAGIEVVAPLRSPLSSYHGLRGERVNRLAAVAELVPECPFGSKIFMDLIASRSFRVLCHHAAHVSEHRSLEFDVVRALAENTCNIRKTIELMAERGTQAVIFTGSFFEANEGVGNWPMRAFSPYGLSKGLTSEVIRHWCLHYDIPFGKFVIPNPFGPFEEPRFCAYMIKQWRNGQVAEVRTPRYVRDNIHVDLLALSYAHFVEGIVEFGHSDKIGPMGYVETQGAFAERFAAAMRDRLGWACEVQLLTQTDFSEPLVRINSHVIDTVKLGWVETAAWDAIAEYYLSYT
jgi:UDP-glucose 4-epimerase